MVTATKPFQNWLKRQHLNGQNLALFAVVVLAFLVPVFIKGYLPFHILTMVCIYGVTAQAWNILGGYAGQISFGHTVYFGIAAYVSTMLLLFLGVNPWVGMLCGAGASIILSILIGYPTFRVSGKYFSIGSIALLMIVQIFFINFDLVGGAKGMVIPTTEESFINLQFNTGVPYYYIALVMLIVSTLIVYFISRSKIGYYLLTIREGEEVAESLGVDTVGYKLFAGAVSAFFCAFAGTLYVQYIRYIDPVSVISLNMSTRALLFVVVGGKATVLGPIVGSILLFPFSEISRFYLGGSASGADLLLTGLLIILVLRFQPGGLVRIPESIRMHNRKKMEK